MKSLSVAGLWKKHFDRGNVFRIADFRSSFHSCLYTYRNGYTFALHNTWQGKKMSLKKFSNVSGTFLKMILVTYQKKRICSSLKMSFEPTARRRIFRATIITSATRVKTSFCRHKLSRNNFYSDKTRSQWDCSCFRSSNNQKWRLFYNIKVFNFFHNCMHLNICSWTCNFHDGWG